MERKREMGKERGPENGEEKRPEHQGNLIQEEQQEDKEHGSKELLLRHGSDTDRREAADLSVRVAAGLFFEYHNLLSPVRGEIAYAAR